MAEVRSLILAIDSRAARPGATRMVRQLGRVTRSVQTTDAAMKGLVGTGASLARTFKTLVVGFLAFRAIRASVGQLIQFEQAMVGVAKTADLTAAQTASLGNELSRLSRTLPVTSVRLAEIAKAAGQLGVTGEGNLLEFSKAVAKLGTSTDLAGEDAAISLARMLNVTGEAFSTVGTLATVITRLGNEFAATESEIAFTATEVAKAGAAFGISTTQAAGFAAALKSMGVQSELARGSFGRTFILLQRVIDDAVTGGGQQLANFNRVLGLTGDQFKQIFDADPTEGLQFLIQRLSELGKEGRVTTTVLKQLGITNIRDTQVLGPLAARYDLLARAIETAKDEQRERSALDREAARGAATLGSRLSILGNTFLSFFDGLSQSNGALAEMVDVVSDAVAILAGMERNMETASGSGETLAKVIRSAATATATWLGLKFLFFLGSLVVKLATATAAVGRYAAGTAVASASTQALTVASFRAELAAAGLGVQLQRTAAAATTVAVASRSIVGPILGILSILVPLGIGLSGLSSDFDSVVSSMDRSILKSREMQSAFEAVGQSANDLRIALHLRDTGRIAAALQRRRLDFASTIVQLEQRESSVVPIRPTQEAIDEANRITEEILAQNPITVTTDVGVRFVGFEEEQARIEELTGGLRAGQFIKASEGVEILQRAFEGLGEVIPGFPEITEEFLVFRQALREGFAPTTRDLSNLKNVSIEVDTVIQAMNELTPDLKAATDQWTQQADAVRRAQEEMSGIPGALKNASGEQLDLIQRFQGIPELNIAPDTELDKLLAGLSREIELLEAGSDAARERIQVAAELEAAIARDAKDLESLSEGLRNVARSEADLTAKRALALDMLEELIAAREEEARVEEDARRKRDQDQDIENALRRFRDTSEQIQFNTQALRMNNRERERARALRDAVGDTGLILNTGQEQLIEGGVDAFLDLERVREIGDGIGIAFANAFETIATGADSAKDSLRNFLVELETLLLRRLVLDPLVDQFGTFFTNILSPPAQEDATIGALPGALGGVEAGIDAGADRGIGALGASSGVQFAARATDGARQFSEIISSGADAFGGKIVEWATRAREILSQVAPPPPPPATFAPQLVDDQLSDVRIDFSKMQADSANKAAAIELESATDVGRIVTGSATSFAASMASTTADMGRGLISAVTTMSTILINTAITQASIQGASATASAVGDVLGAVAGGAAGSFTRVGSTTDLGPFDKEFAKGGVVGSPTLFDMKVGLSGEAGPEAIMPLRRGIGGQMGLRVAGSADMVPIGRDAEGFMSVMPFAHGDVFDTLGGSVAGGAADRGPGSVLPVGLVSGGRAPISSEAGAGTVGRGDGRPNVTNVTQKININTKDATGFRRNRGQISRQLLEGLRGEGLI